MSIYITRTNQKLYFARLHLAELRKAMESNHWSKHALVESFNESVLFHLACAYRSFLGEIAEQYRAEPEQAVSLAALEAMLEAKGVETPEVAELKELESRDSWLSEMQRAWDACWKARDKQQAERSEHQSLSEIHVVQVNPDHAEEAAVADQLEEWHNQFRELIERLRESLQEW